MEEVPQVTVKYEKLDDFTLSTKPNINNETQIMDVPEIKPEFVKLESCWNVSIPTNLDLQLKMSEETKMIGNDSDCMLNSSSYKKKIKQQESNNNLKGSEEIKFEKIDDLIDVKWKIENEEINIKEDKNVMDEGHSSLSQLVPDKRHTEGAASSQKNKIFGGRQSFSCDHCEYETTNKYHFKRHLEKQQKPENMIKLKCKICDFETFYKPCLQQHIIVKHKKREEGFIYKCDQCDHQTTLKRSSSQHILMHKRRNEGKLLKCDQCNFQTIYKDYLNRHSLKHKNPDELEYIKCDHCDYKTVHRNYLTRHLLIHKNRDENDMYKCDKCSYQSVRSKNLKHHLQKHKNPDERTLYKCAQCDENMQYQTFNKNNLIRHILEHKKLGALQ